MISKYFEMVVKWYGNEFQDSKILTCIGRQKDKPKGVVRWNPTLKKVNRNNASNMAKGNFVLPYDWIFFNHLETHCTFGSLLLRGLLKVKYSQNVCLTTPINSLGYSEWSVLDFLEPSTKKYTEGFLVSITMINIFLIMYRFCGILWHFHVVVWAPLGLLDIQS